MYNWLCNHLYDLKLLYPKQFSSQRNSSIDHAILQQVDRIHEALEDNKCTLPVFIDVSKAFDTIDHNILLKKREIDRKVGTNLK